MRKNITVALAEETARWLRVAAAKRDTSVSGYLAELLERERARDEGYADAMDRFLSRAPRPLGPSGEPLPTRDDLHRR